MKPVETNGTDKVGGTQRITRGKQGAQPNIQLWRVQRNTNACEMPFPSFSSSISYSLLRLVSTPLGEGGEWCNAINKLAMK